jgi:hypothetical protein
VDENHRPAADQDGAKISFLDEDGYFVTFSILARTKIFIPAEPGRSLLFVRSFYFFQRLNGLSSQKLVSSISSTPILRRPE